jgi:hypothetical protein
MKTAMQDVLDLVQKRLNEFDGLNGFEVTMMRQELNWFKEILSNNFEKEKKQIIDPVNRLCDFYGHEHIGEQMYNVWYVKPILKPINK